MGTKSNSGCIILVKALELVIGSQEVVGSSPGASTAN